MTLLFLLALAQPRFDLASLAGPCDARALTQSFDERLQSLAPGQLPSGAVVSLRWRGGRYLVEIAQPGHAPVQRPLAAGDDCELVAQLAALIVERYVRALPPPPPSQPPAVAEPEPDAPAKLSFSAGGAGLLGSRGEWQPGFQVQLARRTESWTLGLTLATATAIPDAMRPGYHRPLALDGPTALLAASAGRCAGSSLRACIGPYLGARWSGFTTSAEAGAALSADLALTSHLRFALSLLAGTTTAASVGLLVF